MYALILLYSKVINETDKAGCKLHPPADAQSMQDARSQSKMDIGMLRRPHRTTLIDDKRDLVYEKPSSAGASAVRLIDNPKGTAGGTPMGMLCWANWQLQYVGVLVRGRG